MTVIIGLVAEDGLVYMGADSALSNSYELIACANRKVFQVGPFLMGVCGSARVADVLRHAFVPPKHPRGMDAGRYMRTVLLDAMRECFRKSGMYETHQPEQVDGDVLIAYKRGLYVLQGGDLHIHETVDDFVAIGSGGSVANGAMAVSHGIPAAKRVKAALEASERYTPSVRRPLYVVQGAK